MGISTDALLVYGILIPEGELYETPPFDQVDIDEGEDEGWPTEWLENLARKEMNMPAWYDLPKDATERSRIIARYPHFWEPIKEYPVELVIHQHVDAPQYILAVSGLSYSASRGYPVEITTNMLVIPKLKAMEKWCNDHGFPYEEPKWWLASMADF